VARGVRVGTVTVGGGAPLALIAGPCVIESRDAALRHAERVREIAARAGLPVIYKSSFDKANRTSLDGFRGVGMEEGLAVLAEVRRETGLAVLTDVHEKAQVAAVAAVVDVLQTPAFLCRQTDFIVAVAAAASGEPEEGASSSRPARWSGWWRRRARAGNQDLLVTERGFVFGYNNLVGRPALAPDPGRDRLPGRVRCDAQRAAAGRARHGIGGERRFVAPLARRRVAAGADAASWRCTRTRAAALSDGATSVPLATCRRSWANWSPSTARCAGAPASDDHRSAARARAGAYSTSSGAPCAWATASTALSRAPSSCLLACRGRVIVSGVGKSAAFVVRGRTRPPRSPRPHARLLPARRRRRQPRRSRHARARRRAARVSKQRRERRGC